GPFGQVEVLDREIEVGRAARRRGDVAELEALRRLAHVGDETDQRAQRVARAGQRLTRRDGAVRLDVEHEAVVVGRLLNARRLDHEGDPPDGREDRVDGDDPDSGRTLVALGRDVAA